MDPNDRLYGFYRAKVVENKDPNMFGRVMVWVPIVMEDIPDSKGMWARPANNPVGGRNSEEDSEHHYMGASYIPKKGSWVLVFFEAGNINQPYYFCGLDLENTKVLPENQVGSNYEDKWVVFKSHEGRTVVISDDPDDARVEITGKKRNISNPPTGDTGSVYTIDGNQTTILFDERNGKEKILLRTYKGDYLHIDVDEQMLQAYFAKDIRIETGQDLHFTAARDIKIEANRNVFCEAVTGDIDIKATAANININATTDINILSTANTNIRTTGGILNINSGSILNMESVGIMNIKSGAALMCGGLLVNIYADQFFGVSCLKGTCNFSSTAAGGMAWGCTGPVSIQSAATIALDGTLTYEQSGMSVPPLPSSPPGIAGVATPALPANPTAPKGERNT